MTRTPAAACADLHPPRQRHSWSGYAGPGRENLQAQKTVTVTVEGVGTLQGFGSADPETLNAYDNNVWDTFHGHLLAAIRSGQQAGEITVTVSADGRETRKQTLSVRE